MEQEVWQYYEGYEGILKVSNFGNIMRVRNGIWTNQILTKNSKGYLFFHFENDNWYAHDLVCETFVSKRPSEDHGVDHINDDEPWNNHYTNLQWLTRKENAQKAANKRKAKGAQIRGKRKTVQKTITGEIVRIYESASEAARTIGVDNSTISYACKGNLKTVKGFVFEYLN